MALASPVRHQPILIMMRTLTLVTFLLGLLALSPTDAHAVRIETLTNVRGVRQNQLIGYGLVVGLQGTGDSAQARFTIQSTAAMLRRLGATIDPASIQTKNAAAVMVTATLPAASNPGTQLDVTVSSLGNARSLVGGTLLQTPLYGGDRQVYAVAQGSVITGAFSGGGSSGSSVTQNHLTAGRVPGGAIVERRAAQPALAGEAMVLTLRDPSFVMATRIVDAINTALGEGSASATDGGTVSVKVPEQYRQNPVALMAAINVIDVEADTRAKVVINERTGTVVLGAGVRINEVAIAQGGLTIEVKEQPRVSQPNAFGQGETVVVPGTTVTATAAAGSLSRIDNTATLSDVVTALNALGAKPRDLVVIFQALRSAGALQAEIEVQ